MRYIINDDDYEKWIEELGEVLTVLEANDLFGQYTLKYVINEMKAELSQHLKTE